MYKITISKKNNDKWDDVYAQVVDRISIPEVILTVLGEEFPHEIYSEEIDAKDTLGLVEKSKKLNMK